jgi:hypothetical protein
VTNVRRPSREQMAAEFRAQRRARREAKAKEARRTDDFRQGGRDVTVFGRFVNPGEVPSHEAPAEPPGAASPGSRVRWPWEDER